MNKTSLPKKITPDPIIQAVIEIRFEPKVQGDAVLHFVSESRIVKDYFGTAQELPIYQLPPPVRNSEPGLRYSPYFHLEGGGGYQGYLLQVGPRAISLVSNAPYKGSEDFLEKTHSLFSSINEHGAIGKVERLGIRYIDFFDLNIFDKLTLSLTIPGHKLQHQSSSVRIEFPKAGSFARILHIMSDAKVASSTDGTEKTGSILDIDAFTDHLPSPFFQQAEALLREGHRAQKDLFFSLLKDEFLASLNPEY
jgi:uncharacterized protein (TIGR04255 family)